MPINTSSSILNPNAKQPGGPGAGTQTPNSPFQPTPPTPPTPQEPIPVIVEPTPTAPATNNQFAGLGGISDLYGFSLPSYLQNTIPQAPVTITVNVEGSVITENELVQTVADAVVLGNTNGLVTKRPGGVRVDEG